MCRAPAPRSPRLGDLGGLATETDALYRHLGGTQAEPTLRPGAWDLAFDDGTVVELDEELHFNRYRRSTLEPAWAAALPWSRDYLRHCDEREPACLAAATWGKRWTNPSCVALFGEGAAPGELSGRGAPRWKQRALYDAMKDAASAAGLVRLARVATADIVAGVPLGDVLTGRAEAAPDAVDDLVRQRIAG